MDKQTHHHNDTKVKVTFFISIIAILASVGFFGYSYWTLRQENISLEDKVSVYENALALNQTRLASSTLEKLALADSLTKEKEYTSLFQNQIQNLTGTVGVLEKLSKTDTELLKKYSKVYFLNENYIPPKLVNIPEQYLFVKNKPIEIHEQVWPHLQAMLDSAKASGLDLEIISGYRSFGTQAGLKSTYKVIYGAGTANKFSADQGYSEHQLGTTLDFTTSKVGSTFTGFEKTPEYTWLIANAYKYGFTLSYPKNNTYYVYEPWHYRYVSIPLATKIHDENINFYDLDQRVIDSFLLNFFD